MKETLDDLIKEITELLEPMRSKCVMSFVIMHSPEKMSQEYAIFGNLPQGDNQKLIRDIAIDIAMKDLVSKIKYAKEQEKELEEAESPSDLLN